MLHIRLIVPDPDLQRVLALLQGAPSVTNLWHLENAASKPPGTLVSCDVAKEEGSSILQSLRGEAPIQGYVITELTDVHWEANGILTLRRDRKAFHDRFEGRQLGR